MMARIKISQGFFCNLRRFSSSFIRSPYESPSYPDVKVHELIWNRMDPWADRIAMESAESGKSYTYAQVQKSASNFAQLLRRLGFVDGSRRPVALFLPNCPEFPAASFGGLEAGLPVTNINPIYTPREIIHQLKDSQAGSIVCLPSSVSTLQSAINDLLSPNERPPIFVADDLEFKPLTTNPRPLDAVDNPELLDPRLSFILYSSGTTGLAKGVKLSHASINANCLQYGSKDVRLVRETTPEFQTVLPGVLPFFHCYGLVCILLRMLYDGANTLTFQKFDPSLFIKSLLRKEVEVLYLVPPLVLFLINHPEVTPKHLENIKFIVSGAAPIGVKDIEKLNKKAPKILILQGYGLTEASPVISQTPNKGCPNQASVGRPLPDTEVKITDVDTRKTLPINEIGEVVFRGPQKMLGYLNKPKETDDMIDKEGWLHTGDLGYVDAEGYLYVVDRLKELIKVKGLQVPPAELEELLRAHPQIAEAAVIGIPDERLGEAPRAYVVPKGGTAPDPEEIKLYIAERVAKHKQLAGGVVIVESIPKNATGKILRKELKKLANISK